MNEEQNGRAWYALFVLFAINMMNFFDRQIAAIARLFSVWAPHSGAYLQPAAGWRVVIGRCWPCESE
jgi:hypothetical protein